VACPGRALSHAVPVGTTAETPSAESEIRAPSRARHNGARLARALQLAEAAPPRHKTVLAIGVLPRLQAQTGSPGGVATGLVAWQKANDGVSTTSTFEDSSCRHARDLVRGIGALEHAMVLWESRVNQGLVRFLDARPDALPFDHDAMTDAVMAAAQDDGESFFSPTIWRGARAMRIRVCHPQISDREVRRAIAAVERAIARCHTEPTPNRDHPDHEG
jgi:hypothetical protein